MTPYRARGTVCAIPPWSAARQLSQSPRSPPDSAGGACAGWSLGASVGSLVRGIDHGDEAQGALAEGPHVTIGALDYSDGQPVHRVDDVVRDALMALVACRARRAARSCAREASTRVVRSISSAASFSTAARRRGFVREWIPKASCST